MEEITATDLKARMDRGDKFVLVDVREPHEAEIASIPGAVLIPLGEIEQRCAELNPADEIILHCHAGIRSARALGILEQRGFTRLKNLRGGIAAWTDDVDPSVPHY